MKKLQYNSPVILSFFLVSLLALVLGNLSFAINFTKNSSNQPKCL